MIVLDSNDQLKEQNDLFTVKNLTSLSGLDNNSNISMDIDQDVGDWLDSLQTTMISNDEVPFTDLNDTSMNGKSFQTQTMILNNDSDFYTNTFWKT